MERLETALPTCSPRRLVKGGKTQQIDFMTVLSAFEFDYYFSLKDIIVD